MSRVLLWNCDPAFINVDMKLFFLVLILEKFAQSEAHYHILVDKHKKYQYTLH